jgi:hypothetical protein
MRTRWFVVALLAACSAPRPRTGSGEPVLTVEGRVAGGTAAFGAPDLALLPRRSFVAARPGGEQATYDGVALARLLGEELELERGADTAVFHGRDGYEVAIPVPVLRQLRPVLADQVDGAPLAAARPDAAPLLLAWPTGEAPGLAYDPRARTWWVDRVTRVEVVPWVETYGRALRVPAGAREEAGPGSALFETRCLPCHRLRERGGTRGPALTEHLATPAAREVFPAELRAHEGQPGAAAVAALQPDAVRALSAFLTAVALEGPIQEDEPPPELPPAPPPARPPGVGPPPGM